MAVKEEKIEVEGEGVEALRIPPGDTIKVELSPHDPTRGRITYRHRQPGASP